MYWADKEHISYALGISPAGSFSYAVPLRPMVIGVAAQVTNLRRTSFRCIYVHP